MKINGHNQSIRNAFASCAASYLLVIMAITPLQTSASETNSQWIGSNSSDWTESGNWTAAPIIKSDVMVTDSYSNLNNNVTYSNSSNASAGGSVSSALNSLIVDGSSNVMSLNQNSDSLNTGTLTVGETGTGTYNISGGNLNMTSSSIDDNYRLQSLVLGDYGIGNFNQSNSTFHSNVNTQEMTLGNMYGSSGNYIMSNNNLTNTLNLSVIDKEVIGENGTGTFTQNGGNNLTGALIVGDGTGQSPNSYTLNTGTLIVYGATSISNVMGNTNNTANFTQTGGITTTGALSMANGCNAPDNGGGCTPGSAAYATISGGNFNVTGAATIGAGGYAQFTQSGATTVTTINNLIVGAAASALDTTNTLATPELTSQGVVNLLGGTLHVTDNVIIGAGDSTDNGPATSGTLYGTNGIVNQVGGNFLIEGGLTVGQVGNIVDGQGNYTLSGGQLTIAGNMIVGSGGNFNYSGGSFSLSSGTGILTNEGQINITGDGSLTLSANVINDGNFKVTGTTVEYTGSFTNNGAYLSDPSTHVFNGLIVSTNGYLTGGIGDVFKMQADFYNNSTSGLWATSTATLEFTASPTSTHKMTTMATTFNQYNWGTLQIDSGASLNLNGIYTVGWLNLIDGISQLNMLTGNFIIFYDASLAANDYLAGISDQGHLIAYNTPLSKSDTLSAPEPSTWSLLTMGLLALLLQRRHSFIL